MYSLLYLVESSKIKDVVSSVEDLATEPPQHHMGRGTVLVVCVAKGLFQLHVKSINISKECVTIIRTKCREIPVDLSF